MKGLVESGSFSRYAPVDASKGGKNESTVGQQHRLRGKGQGASTTPLRVKGRGHRSAYRRVRAGSSGTQELGKGKNTSFEASRLCIENKHKDAL